MHHIYLLSLTVHTGILFLFDLDSPTAEFFAQQLNLPAEDLQQMKTVLKGVQEGKAVTEYGLTDSESSDLQFYVEKLAETGFF